MYREIEEDLGFLDLKENLELLFEHQRYPLFMFFRFFFLYVREVKVDLMHHKLMIVIVLLEVSTLMN